MSTCANPNCTNFADTKYCCYECYLEVNRIRARERYRKHREKQLKIDLSLYLEDI